MVSPLGFAQPIANNAAQGDAVAVPIAADGEYFAFLSKEDLVPGPHGAAVYSILFELVPKAWWELAVGVAPDLTVPPSPATFFQIPAVVPDRLISILGVAQDDIAEGSWYHVTLRPAIAQAINGTLYDPTPPNAELGHFSLFSASLLALPDIVDGVIVLVPVTGEKRKFENYPEGPAPPAKRRRELLPAVRHKKPAEPNVTSIGVMDIGQGSCNMLLSGDLGGGFCEPVAYFDVGFPAPFFNNSAPAGIRENGPILQNTAKNLQVILSHWDVDHWSLAVGTRLENLPWIVPKQPMGGAASNFSAKLTQRHVYPSAEPFLKSERGDFILCKCTPPPGSRKGAFVNNSGLAIMVTTVRLPENDAHPHAVVMTGDASFGSLVAVAERFLNVTGITAVHHGSEHHGAQFDLPVPSSPGQGRVAYSYGVRLSSAGRLVHCYGFPRQEAMHEYQAQGWGRPVPPGQPALANGTAEGADINADPPAIGNRGNLRVGAQTPVNPIYGGRAFHTFRNTLT